MDCKRAQATYPRLRRRRCCPARRKEGAGRYCRRAGRGSLRGRGSQTHTRQPPRAQRPQANRHAKEGPCGPSLPSILVQNAPQRAVKGAKAARPPLDVMQLNRTRVAGSGQQGPHLHQRARHHCLEMNWTAGAWARTAARCEGGPGNDATPCGNKLPRMLRGKAARRFPRLVCWRPIPSVERSKAATQHPFALYHRQGRADAAGLYRTLGPIVIIFTEGALACDAYTGTRSTTQNCTAPPLLHTHTQGAHTLIILCRAAVPTACGRADRAPVLLWRQEGHDRQLQGVWRRFAGAYPVTARGRRGTGAREDKRQQQ